jgi:hypothetical protein
VPSGITQAEVQPPGENTRLPPHQSRSWNVALLGKPLYIYALGQGMTVG